MPIYEYACPDCGHLNDHLQKLADAAISACPSCGSSKYYKKISAAGFALKGTGWYVTDFKNGNTAQKVAEKKESADAAASATNGESNSSDAATTQTQSHANGAASPATPATQAPAPTAAPAPAAAPAPSAASGAGK